MRIVKAVTYSLIVAATTISSCLADGLTERNSIPRSLLISADETKFDKSTHIYTASGHVIVKITGQDSLLEADHASFDLPNRLLDVSGNVKITRHDEITTEPHVIFNVNSTEWIVTNPGVEVIDVNGISVGEYKPTKTVLMSIHSGPDRFSVIKK